MLKMLSLFSGIGGMDLAAQWAGIETIAFCEIEPFCQKLLAKRWPNVPLFNDVRTITANTLRARGIGHVDIVCGGFPCQPFSVAGEKRGAKDDRHLWPEMLRVVKESKPAWVVGENVTGLLHMAESIGKAKVESRTTIRREEEDLFSSILTRQEALLVESFCKDLESEGYEVQSFVIPACAAGAFHRRDRVWLVAYSHEQHEQGNQIRVLREQQRRVSENRGEVIRPENGANGSNLSGANQNSSPDSDGQRESQSEGCKRKQWGWIGNEGEDACHATSKRLPDWSNGGVGQPAPLTELERPSGREVERDFCGMAHGVSRRVDRLRALGNAVVPQVVYPIFEAIANSERGDLERSQTTSTR